MHHVFYSWQMRAEKEANRVNRYLIRDALEAAANGLQRPVTVDEATRDVPGSPDIFTTILSKIDRCAAFVADLTLLPLKDDGRFSCNANVLLEYGYALAKKSDQRLIPVVNTHFGPIEELPFDLRHKAIRVRYHLAPSASPEELKAARKTLEGLLRSELRLIVDDPRSILNLSDAELAVARQLLSSSGNGWPRQHVDLEELSAAIGHDLSLTKRAVADLVSRGYAERLAVAGTNTPPIAPTVRLFWDLDRYVVGSDPREDGRRLAEDLVASSDTGHGRLNMIRFQEQSGWALRRLNPALEFLVGSAIVDKSDIAHPDLVTVHIRETENTRAFLRGSFDPDSRRRDGGASFGR